MRMLVLFVAIGFLLSLTCVSAYTYMTLDAEMNSSWNMTFTSPPMTDTQYPLPANQSFNITIPSQADVILAKLNLTGFEEWYTLVSEATASYGERFGDVVDNLYYVTWSDYVYVSYTNGTAYTTYTVLDNITYSYGITTNITTGTPMYWWLLNSSGATINRYNGSFAYNTSIPIRHPSNSSFRGITIYNHIFYIANGSYIVGFNKTGHEVSALLTELTSLWDLDTVDGVDFWVSSSDTSTVYLINSSGLIEEEIINVKRNPYSPISMIDSRQVWTSGKTTKNIQGWNITYPNNTYIDVGNDGGIDYTIAVLNHSNRTTDFSSVIDTYLSSCSGNCNVTIVLHTDQAGIIQIHNINITYKENIDPNITLVRVDPSCVEINQQISWSWTQEEDTVDGNLTHSLCNFTDPAGAVTTVNTGVSTEGLASCAYIMDSSGGWYCRIYIKDNSSNYDTTLNYFTVETTDGCQAKGAVGGGGGGGATAPEEKIIYVCEENYVYDTILEKCIPIPLEEMKEKPAIYGLESKFLQPIAYGVSPFHVLLAGISLSAVYQYIYKKRR